MGQLCYICRRKSSRGDRVSLHKFPKNPIIRNKWIKACDLSLSDDLTYIYICSLHFNPKDIDRGNEFQTRCILKHGVVPSIGVPNPIHVKNENVDPLNDKPANHTVEVPNQICVKNVNVDPLNDETENHPITHNVEMSNIYKNPSADRFSNVFGKIHVQKMQLSTHESDKAQTQQCNSFVKQCKLAYVKCEINENVDNSEENYFAVPQTVVLDPLAISELKSPDLETFKETKRKINFLQDRDKRKSKLIRSLRDRNRKLEKQISSSKQIIAQLKKKKMMSNRSNGTLLAMIAGNDVTLSKVNGEYCPEIRTFAMKLYSYSTKAYNYTRKKFNNTLPGPSTVRAWYQAVDKSPGLKVESLEDTDLRTEQKSDD